MILGVIPARGESKTIPKKNIKPIAGKPLIAWTIEAALQSKRLDQFIVSTEDEEIASISREYGAPVHIRPQELATDTSSTWSVLEYVIQEINPDIIVLLQPTSPVRDHDLIDRCIEQFIASGVDFLATGCMATYFAWGSYHARRQELKPFFHDDGNVYVMAKEIVSCEDRFTKKLGRVAVSKEENIELDDQFDFWLAEKILEKRFANI